MKENNAVSIVGVGACNAVGFNAPMSAASVRAGIARIGEHPYMIDKAGEPMIVARAAYLSDHIVGIERFTELALPAVQEALAPLNRDDGQFPAIPLVLGLPAARPGLPPNLAEEIANRFTAATDERYLFSGIETITCGHSAGLMAIEEGCRKIRGGSVDFCLAGGVDSYLEPETLEWLDWEEQLHSDTNRYGFIPGEAAGFCLLASQQASEGYKLRILGKVLAVATSQEKNLIKTDTVCTGEGLTNAFKQVMQVLSPPDLRIDQTLCDMNGERYRADEYGFTIARVSEYFVDATDFLTPADCWADVGAASGLLFVNLAIASGLRGYGRGPITLVWTSSERGERSAAIVQVSCQQKN